MRPCAAEFLGTFCLVFAGTGAVVVNDISGGVVTHVGVALTFGLVVLAMIYALGDVSGAHLNPAVTLGFYLAGRMPGKRVLPYIASQTAGAIAASFSLRYIFSEHGSLGMTRPVAGDGQSFALELILTLMLMFVILSVSTGAREKGVLAGVAVGAVIALEAMFAGPISGASMNPARSLAPALAMWNMESLWLYLTAPLVGAAIGVLGCHVVQPAGCCKRPGQCCGENGV